MASLISEVGRRAPSTISPWRRACRGGMQAGVFCRIGQPPCPG
jgi:hypothetical protein